MSYYNVWLAVSNQVREAKQERITAVESGLEVESLGRELEGRDGGKEKEQPALMRAEVEATLSKVADATVETLYRKPVIGGKTYTLLSLYFNEPVEDPLQLAKEALQDYPADTMLLGIWHWDGRRFGDLHPEAWRLMPDRIEYDSEGNVTNTIPASSNADLRDINLVLGQSPRNFA